MAQPELLKQVAGLLNRESIPYFITGSVAAGVHGYLRATHDVDIIVVLQDCHVDLFLNEFSGPDFYLEEIAIRRAMTHHQMFNLIYRGSEKIDFWISPDEPFERMRMKRRVMISAMGQEIWVASAEDTILAKLRWAKLSGGSEKQLKDVKGVYEFKYPDLDFDYLQFWVKQLGVEKEWGDVLEDVGDSKPEKR